MSLFGCHICGVEGHDEVDCPERGEQHTEVVGMWMFADLHLAIIRTWDEWESTATRITTYLRSMRDGTKQGTVRSQYIPESGIDYAVTELERIWWSLHRPKTDDDAEQLTLEGT